MDYKALSISLFLLVSFPNIFAMEDWNDFEVDSLCSDEINEYFEEYGDECVSFDSQSLVCEDYHISAYQQIDDEPRVDFKSSFSAAWKDSRAKKIARVQKYHGNQKQAVDLKRVGGILSEKQSRLAQLYENQIIGQRERLRDGKSALDFKKNNGNLSEKQQSLAQLYENYMDDAIQRRENTKNAFNLKKTGGVLSKGEELLAQLHEKRLADHSKRWQNGKSACERKKAGEILSEKDEHLVVLHEKKLADGSKLWQDKKNAFKRKSAGETLSEEEKKLVVLYEQQALAWKKRWQNGKSACKRKKADEILSEKDEHLVVLHEAFGLSDKQARKKNRVQSEKDISTSVDVRQNKRDRDRTYQKNYRAKTKEALQLQKEGAFLPEPQQALIAAYAVNLSKQRERQKNYKQRQNILHPKRPYKKNKISSD